MTGRADACWACGSESLSVARRSTLRAAPDSRMFAITSSQYGQTGEIQRCGRCGFLQCSKMEDVLGHYEELQDPCFEETRSSRSLQERRLARLARRFRFPGKLLDVGAASGALVEQALQIGYAAEGIEPSRWLHGKAAERGLPVHLGTLPHPEARGPYDVVTMVDVIEHVPQPLEVIRRVREVLAPGGIMLIVTPNVGSWAARLLGWRWWHFRAAHIGYFTPKTLDLLMGRAGLSRIHSGTVVWYFDLGYLGERMLRYLPKLFTFRPPSFLRRVTIPLALGDSMLHVYSAEGGR